MCRITHQEDASCLEVLGHTLYRPPICHVHNLNVDLRLSQSGANQFSTALKGKIARRFSVRGVVGNGKHAAILIGNQEHATSTLVAGQDSVGFIASDELTPVRTKVYKDLALGQLSQSPRGDAELLAYPAVSTISCDQVIGVDFAGLSRGTVSDCGRDIRIILSKGDQLGAITHI